MIDRSIIQDYQGCDTLGADAQPHHYVLWKLASLLNATVFIGISTIYCPHSVILRVIDTINVEKFLVRKENSHGFLFSKIVSNPIRKFFPFDLLIIGK